ncbi:MAG: cupin domain-containing protein [Actinomycetota bacterium]|nr:cupin domain-containing protein [Acidimicrobiales bacterium]MEC9270670.1 cupin domain-containing protein [Actinomycetota bacterium]MEC9316743.1 cupin domain-containing protein [Actinomycetota bacterium]
MKSTAVTELLCQQLTDAEFGKTGRRSFFEYRDTGLSQLTEGEYRAQVMRATDVMETTGWHYHECDLQFVYVLNGWVDLEFEGGRSERVSAGAALSIPPGMVHNEISCSSDFEALEVVAPADMVTVPCDPPK